MSDALRDLFVEVTGEETTTDHQLEEPSHDPVDESVREVEATVEDAGQHALGDAVDGAEIEDGEPTAN